MRIGSKRTTWAGIIAVGIVLVAVAAYAYFTGSGTGTGAASVGSASPWEVSGVSTTGGPLLPASGTETISYTVTNSSNGNQQLNSVVVTVGDDGNGNVLNADNGNAAVPGCLVSWFTVDNSGAPATPANLAGGASVTGSATVALTESGTSQDPCQGVSPQLVVTAG